MSLLGGVWNVLTKPIGIGILGFSWSGEAYLSYSLSASCSNGGWSISSRQ